MTAEIRPGIGKAFHKRANNLTPDQKRDIKLSRLTVKELAAKYNVSLPTIYACFKKKSV